MKEQIEKGAYVALGAVDYALEKAKGIPVIGTLADFSLVDSLKSVEPKVRRQVSDLRHRGEDLLARARKGASKTFSTDSISQLKDFGNDSVEQIKEFGAKIVERTPLKTKSKSKSKAA